MIFNRLATTALLLAGVAFSAKLPASSSLHEKRNFVPSDWIKGVEAPRDAKLPMRIFLTPRSADQGHDHLMAISDPKSAEFGKHWTPKQVHDFFSASPQAVTAVQEWLVSSGIPLEQQKVAPSRSYVAFEADVDAVESLLGAQYNSWEHVETGSSMVSCDEYHVPKHLKHHIDFITPTVSLGRHSSLRRNLKRESPLGSPMIKPVFDLAIDPTSLVNCSEAVTPQCVKALYEVPSATSAVAGNEMGIFESGDIYDQESLDVFFSKYYPTIPNGTHPILQSIDGGVAPISVNESGGESALDFDLSFPLVYPQKIKLYQTLDVGTQPGVTIQEEYGIFDPFLDALDASYCTYDGGDNPKYDPTFNYTEDCGTYKPTNVISISYEIAEAYFPPSFLERQCHEFMKLGLMGTSLVFSSGDNGTLSRAGVEGCLAGGAQNPGFPSSCPYVTAVGATQIQPGANITAPEVAVNPLNNPFAFEYYPAFSSGGGFSNVFARPSYQDSAVSGYLNNTSIKLPASSTYNQSGRAFPDVAANGYNIVTASNGYAPELSSGTSASAPIFASIINRLNEERISAGKGPIGFLNPILYSHPEMFNDIVEGYNLGCNAATAFNCTKGWDPVTGLGTPNYPKMLKVFLDLP